MAEDLTAVLRPGPAKDFKELHRIRGQVRSAAIGLVFGDDDGYISRWSFRAHQVSLRRLSGCDRSFQVPQTCTTDAFVQCFPDEADHVGSWAAFFFGN